MISKALVTGGAGFIGSHLAARLLNEGFSVRILDNLSSGCIDNLPLTDSHLDFLQGDVRDFDTCVKACNGADTVFHMAAIPSVVSSVEDPLASHAVTLGGTLHVLEAARRAGVRRLVFSSSASIYGDAEIVPTPEGAPFSPQSPYATAKAASEFYCRNYASLYGLETVILRYFNVFGPGQNISSGYAAVIPLFIRAALTQRQPTVFGDGLQTRDFVYVENVVDANLLAASRDGVAGATFNVAGGNAVSLLDLLRMLENVTGHDMAPQYEPARAGEVRHSRADVSRATQRLGFVPRVSVEDGLQFTLDAARAVTVKAAG